MDFVLGVEYSSVIVTVGSAKVSLIFLQLSGTTTFTIIGEKPGQLLFLTEAMNRLFFQRCPQFCTWRFQVHLRL